MCMEENVKLKVLEKYFKDHLNKDLVVVMDKNYFIGSDKHIYNEALLLCKKYGLGDYAKYITINKEMINHEVDNMNLRDILDVYEVLENKYSYNGDTYTICKI